MPKLLLCLAAAFLASSLYSQVPVLNSLPGASHIVFLDFDGHTVNGTSWNGYNSGNPIVCANAGIDSNKIKKVFQVVAEDYRPFNINVTTDSSVFNAAPMQQKVRVLVTTSSGWYPSSVGGVAYLSSFTSTMNNVCFVFPNKLSYNEYYIAEACSHEAGHTLGLSHHSDWSATCTKNNEYYQGIGSGETSWAPIMGVGYYRNMTTWANTAANGSCSGAQSDMERIVAVYNNGVAFRSDDHANLITAATLLTPQAGVLADSGIITQDSDVDMFKLQVDTLSRLSVQAKPWEESSVNIKSNLDILIKLLDSNGHVLLSKDSISYLNAAINNVLLMPGVYFISVDGTFNGYQSGYASVGKYYVNGAIVTENDTAFNAAFVSSQAKVCKGSSLNFFDQSIGNVVSRQWTFTGASPSSSTQVNPVGITYANAGTYNVRLVISDGSRSDTFNTYVVVNNLPTISISASNTVACGYSGVDLTASGALFYAWNSTPTLNNTVLPKVHASPTLTTIYTVSGMDANACSNSATKMVMWAPTPVLAKTPSSNFVYICLGDSVALSVNGANTYKWTPFATLSDSVGNTVKAFPTNIAFANYYNVQGTDSNGCVGYAYFQVVVRKCDSLAVDIISDTAAICVGDSVNFMDFSTGTPTYWYWSFPGATPAFSYLQHPGFVKYNASGNYNVSLTISNGSDTVTRVYNNFVGVAAIPNVIVSPASLAMCVGDSITINLSGASNYSWVFDSTLNVTYGASVKSKSLVSKIYSVTATNYASGGGGGGSIGTWYFTQCSSTLSIPLQVNSLPVLNLTQFPLPAYNGDSIALNMNIPSGQSYSWSGPQSSTAQIHSIAMANAVIHNGVYTANIIDSNGCKDTAEILVNILPAPSLQAKVFLAGPYNVGSGLMIDSLRSKNLLPYTEPYSVAPYNSIFTHLNGGLENSNASVFAVTGNDAIVDWVFVELRSKTNSSQVVGTKAALLQRDGDVVDARDGISPLAFRALNPDSFYVAIRHRNHLGVMTKFPVYLPASGATVDFTAANAELYRRVMGNNSFPYSSTQDSCTRRLGAGQLRALYAGNANIATTGSPVAAKLLRYNGSGNDRLSILSAAGATATLAGYYKEDLNLNGELRYNGANNDRLILLQNIGGNTNTVVQEQLPD